MARMATDIPQAITTPASVETRLGTLRFTDGFPDDATVEKAFDNLDFQRGVQALLTTLPAASLSAMRRGIRTFGPDNQTVIIFESLMDSRSLFLTANTESIYALAWLNLKDGPVVVESPPNTLGLVDDFWFRYVTDLGNAGPDKGKGGKFLFLPPGYKGNVPAGYHVFRSRTFSNQFGTRGFLVNGDPKPGVESIKQRLRIYPLAQAAKPPATNFINVSGRSFNTIHSMDFSFFEEVNEVIQEEPADATDPETLGLLASIGIDERNTVRARRTHETNPRRGRISGSGHRPYARLSHAHGGGATSIRTARGKRRSSAAATNSCTRCPHPGCAIVLFLLRHRHHPGDVGEDGRRRFAVCRRVRRRQEAAARWRQDLSPPSATRHSGERLLVAGRLRQPDPLSTADRSAVP